MHYDLVFEGGGAKGMAFAGAMREFEAAGHTVGRIIGSSAGAITAATLAASYSAAEMLAALGERRWASGRVMRPSSLPSWATPRRPRL